ncbi:hypothetical protein [Pararhizobium sp. LjRoot238]|uniref:hypothetical protein n=1 Tax=Pararhizobium sp. LjRoot238 TaxID=3342293 RepID=UPI003ECD4820
MTSNRKLGAPILVAGAVFTLSAVGWWWLIFSKVVINEYLTLKQATVCLAGATDLCTLAQLLCTDEHLYGIRWYAPEGFWMSATVLALGLFLSLRPSTA